MPFDLWTCFLFSKFVLEECFHLLVWYKTSETKKEKDKNLFFLVRRNNLLRCRKSVLVKESERENKEKKVITTYFYLCLKVDIKCLVWQMLDKYKSRQTIYDCSVCISTFVWKMFFVPLNLQMKRMYCKHTLNESLTRFHLNIHMYANDLFSFIKWSLSWFISYGWMCECTKSELFIIHIYI